jgi:glycosyltransferase involved in cell wall biosynthesis
MSDRIPQSPPPIAPITSARRPLWSVMIPTYNCTRFVAFALKSVLQQDPGADVMQIEVVDDFSTDGDVEAIVQEIGQGRVLFYRQPENKGSLRNFETCLNRAKGHWVHLLHGDDLVRNGFYKEIQALFEAHPQAGAAFVKNSYINTEGYETGIERQILEKNGIIENWLDIIATRQRLQPPAIVVKREVYEKLGGFFAVHYGEDWEMYTRIAAYYPVAYSPKYLAKYRVHGHNITSQSYLKGQHVNDLKMVINIIQGYLPPHKRKKIRKASLKTKSVWFARHAHAVYLKDPQSALLHARHALILPDFYTSSILQSGTVKSNKALKGF